MKKRIFILITVLMAVWLALLTSCSPPKPARTKKYKVGVSLMNRQQSFYKDLEDSLVKAAEENDVELDIKNAEQDSSKQLNGVETLLVGNIDALILCPVDSNSAGACVLEANNKNIPVFTVDIGAKFGKVVCHIASDNVAGGRKAANYMAKILNNKGKIVILNSPMVTSVQRRVQGFKEVAEKHPEMEIIADIDGGAQKEPAMKAMEDLLQAHSQIDGVFAINDETALGALRAVEASGRKGINIIGYDATPQARKEILKGGSLKADVVQYPGKMGEAAIKTVVKHLQGEKVPDRIPVDVGILDRKALREMKK